MFKNAYFLYGYIKGTIFLKLLIYFLMLFSAIAMALSSFSSNNFLVNLNIAQSFYIVFEHKLALGLI
jgi:hypothetical protein